MKRAFAVAALLAVRPAAAEVRLCVPAFDGPGAIGLQVATVLNLQVFQTLRRSPWPNPGGLVFPDGTVVWSDQPLPASTFEAAEAMARAARCQLVLWGRARSYGEGIVVQAYLAALDLEPAQEALWVVPVKGPSGAETISCGLPRSRWEFASIVLDPAIVQQFSRPDALEIRRGPGSGDVLGVLGPRFEAERHEKDFVLLRKPVAGWVHLPRLSSTKSEIVDFTAGIVRVLRGDWGGAGELFGQVTSNPRAPTALRVDAHLLGALSSERQGRSGARDLARAEALNPYSPAVVRYRVVSDLAELGRLSRPTVPRSPPPPSPRAGREPVNGGGFASGDVFGEAPGGGGRPRPRVPPPPPPAAGRPVDNSARIRELSARVERTLSSPANAYLVPQDAWTRKAREAAVRAKQP